MRAAVNGRYRLIWAIALRKGSSEISPEAAIGLAQPKDKENRAGDRERAHQQRHRDGCIEAREQTETEKQRHAGIQKA
jgi:hypothetical protein